MHVELAILGIIWLACLTWKALPDIAKMRRSVKVSGTVTNLRTEMTSDGLIHSPDVTFVDLDGRTRTAPTGAGASWRHWKIGDPATVLIDEKGEVELYWPKAFYGVLCIMYGGGIFIVTKALYDAYITQFPH